MRRDVLERVDDDHGVATASRDAAALLDRLLDGLRLGVGRGREGQRRERRDRTVGPLRELTPGSRKLERLLGPMDAIVVDG
ncbi:MAG TPA: hypothetical protein VE526_05780 [Solirubrobacteraceae bacterium]|nr:hypothetical protein [Solirubrobacteraceae bacterium]